MTLLPAAETSGVTSPITVKDIVEYHHHHQSLNREVPQRPSRLRD